MPRKLLADSYRGWYGWEGQHNSMLRMSNNTVWECQHKMDLERFRHQLKMHQLEASQACRNVSARRAYHSLQDEYYRIRAEQAVLHTHAFTSYDPKLASRPRTDYDPKLASRPRTDKPVPSAKARIRGKRRPKTERLPSQPSELNDKQFKRNSLPSIGNAEFSAIKERKRPEEKPTTSREKGNTSNPSSPAEVITLVELERRKKAAPTTTTTRSRKQSTASSRRGHVHLKDSDIMTSSVLEEDEEDNGGGVDTEGDDDVFYESDVLKHSTASLVSSDKDTADPHPYNNDVSAEMTVETGVMDDSLEELRPPEQRPGKDPSADSFQRIEYILDTKKNPTSDSGILSSTHYVKPSTPISTAKPFPLHQTKDVNIPHGVAKTLEKGESPMIRTLSPRKVSHGGVYLTKLEPNSTASEKVTTTVKGKDAERSSLLHARLDAKNSGANSPAKSKHEKRAEVLPSPRPGSFPNPKHPEKPVHRPRTEVRQNVLAPLPTSSSLSKRSGARPSLVIDDPAIVNKTTDDHHRKPETTVVSPRKQDLSPRLKPVHAPNPLTPDNSSRDYNNHDDDDKPETNAVSLQRQQLSPRINPVQVLNSHTSASGSSNNPNNNNSDTTVTRPPKQPSPRPKTLDSSNAASSNHDDTNNKKESQPDAGGVAPGFRLAKFRKAAEVIIEEKRMERETNMSVFAALFMHKAERQQLKLRPVEKPACVQEQENQNMWQELLLNVQSAVRWKAKILREKEGILNTRQMRKKAHEDQQVREKARRHVFPGHCKTTYAMKKFLSKEIDDLVEAWRPENVRKHRNKQLVQRATLPEFVDRTRSTTAILKDFKKYQSKHEDVGAG